MHKFIQFLLFTVIIFVLSSIAFAQNSTLSGNVTSIIDKGLIPGVSVEIPKINRNTLTDENGRYEFTNLPNGTYTVITHAEGFSDKAQTVTVSGDSATLDFNLTVKQINEEVTITATGNEESVYDSFSSVNSVGSTRIVEKASTSIGDILEDEAGVSKRSFGGGGSGRPTIRGFEGDRVLVLQDGVRNGSLGSQSGDHGEPIAATNLERLEVIKGPATLLYGSNAIGGVINAVTDDENTAHKGFRGYFTGLGGTVNRQAGVAGGLEYGYGKSLFNINLNSTREGDYETPLGRIPNSASRGFGGSGGGGYFADKYFFRGTVSLDRRRYGIPYVPLFESGELLSIANGGADCSVVACGFNTDVLQDTFADQLPPVPDEQVDIKMRRNNVRFVGGFRDVKGAITKGTFSFDLTDYRHRELEIDGNIENIATTFDNDVFSYRGVFQQANYKQLSGTFGFEGYRRNYLTVGDEALIDGKVSQNNFSFFGLEEISFEKFSLQLGGRVENNRYRPNNSIYLERDFTGFSGGIGAKFNVWKGGSFVANYSSSYRPPSLEELYNFGLHIGTVTFEIGDQNLERERSNGFEFSFRQNSRKVRFNGSVFYNDLNNFIYLAPQDGNDDGIIDIEDGLPAAAYVQKNARFLGADASLNFDINEHFGIFAVGDIVNAKLKDLDIPLPRIAPARLRIGTDIRFNSLSLRPEAVFTKGRNADEIFTLETPTDGYSILNINGSYAFVNGRLSHIFTFGLHNLTDELYRNHTNFIKFLTPEAGRGFKFSYTLRLF